MTKPRCGNHARLDLPDGHPSIARCGYCRSIRWKAEAVRALTEEWWSVAEIAAELGISERRVQRYRVMTNTPSRLVVGGAFVKSEWCSRNAPRKAA